MGVNGLTALVFGRLFDRYGIQIIVLGIFGFGVGFAVWLFAGSERRLISAWRVGPPGWARRTRRCVPAFPRSVSMNKRGTAFGSFNCSFTVCFGCRERHDGGAVPVLANRRWSCSASWRNSAQRSCLCGCDGRWRQSRRMASRLRPRGQYHLRERVDPTPNPTMECLMHPLAQVY